MDSNILSEIIKQGSSYAILVWVLYWLFTKYIPTKDAEHKIQIESSQALFKESLNTIVTSYTNSIAAISVRLDRIEEDIRNNKK